MIKNIIVDGVEYTPIDKWLDLKQAQEEGAIIEAKQSYNEWHKECNPKWYFDAEYRIKDNINDIITYDDIQGFIDLFEESDDQEWAESEVQSDIDTVNDIKYQEYKDER